MKNDRTGRTPYNSLYKPIATDTRSKAKLPKECKTPYNSLYIPVPPSAKTAASGEPNVASVKKHTVTCCKHGRPCSKYADANKGECTLEKPGPDTNNLYEDVMKIEEVSTNKTLGCDDFSTSLTDKLKKLEGSEKTKKKINKNLVLPQATIAESSDENERSQSALVPDQRQVRSDESPASSKKKRKKSSKHNKRDRALKLPPNQSSSSEFLDNEIDRGVKGRSRRVPRSSILGEDFAKPVVPVPNDGQDSYAYIGACTYKKAENKTKNPLDISLYHKLRKTNLNDIDVELPLFLCYHTSRAGIFKHYPVHTTWIAGHRKFFVEVGEPEPVLHANIDDLIYACKKQFSLHEVDDFQ